MTWRAGDIFDTDFEQGRSTIGREAVRGPGYSNCDRRNHEPSIQRSGHVHAPHGSASSHRSMVVFEWWKEPSPGCAHLVRYDLLDKDSQSQDHGLANHLWQGRERADDRNEGGCEPLRLDRSRLPLV